MSAENKALVRRLTKKIWSEGTRYAMHQPNCAKSPPERALC